MYYDILFICVINLTQFKNHLFIFVSLRYTLKTISLSTSDEYLFNVLVCTTLKNMST